MRFISCVLLVAFAGAANAQTDYEWKTPPPGIENSMGRLFLWHSGAMIGFWEPKEGYYRAWLGGDSWGPQEAEPPHPIPSNVHPNFGVDEANTGKKHTITLNGREISHDKALQVIEQTKIPDDSNKFRLVVIGDEVDRKRVTDAWAGMDQETRDRFAVWSVPGDHWSLKNGETGETVFHCGGSPTVYCLAPGGMSLHRQDSFSGFGDFDAIRKAVKQYDAAKDPDLRKPDPKKPPNNPTGEPLHPLIPIAVLLGAAGVYYASRKDKQ